MMIKILGELKPDNGSDKTHIQNYVYDSLGIAPTLTARGYKDPRKVLVRSNNGSKSDRTPGVKTEQRLEPNRSGVCNTLTSVQKDNLILEVKALRMVRTEEGKKLRKAYESGEIHHGFNEYREAEPREDGISNTITTVQKDNMVLEQLPISTKGKEIGVASTILAGYERSNMTGFNSDNGVLEQMKIKRVGNISSDGLQCGTVLSVDGLSGTLSAGTYGYANNHICEKVKIKQATKQGYIECKIGGVADLSYPDSKTRRGRVQDCGNTSPTLTAGESDICKIESPYRIRKLTPKECWRLMGFSDEEFTAAESVNSNTQLYKQAGNSIVVDVLEHLFKNIFETLEEEEMKKVEETKTIKFETDKMIDLETLQEKEPELFDELANDYPCEKATYIYEVKRLDEVEE